MHCRSNQIYDGKVVDRGRTFSKNLLCWCDRLFMYGNILEPNQIR
jgi:hypothetical protein